MPYWKPLKLARTLHSTGPLQNMADLRNLFNMSIYSSLFNAIVATTKQMCQTRSREKSGKLLCLCVPCFGLSEVGIQRNRKM
jgi:hypothetical protein